MGRPSEGWKLRPPRGRNPYHTVRFHWQGADVERSTGTAEPERAAQEAARIYAAFIRKSIGRKRVVSRQGSELEGACRQWLSELRSTLDCGTVASYADYVDSHWLDFFGSVHAITDESCNRYMRNRLGKVQASTVRKELSALRGFCRWAELDVTVPSVPKRTLGTPYKDPRRKAAIAISRREAQRIIAALPERSSDRKDPSALPYPVRARFEVAYETGLRPATLDRLEAPEHYRKGAMEITITPAIEKIREPRVVPLTARARKALDRVCPKQGPIFGAHDYREPIWKAAKAVLGEHRAELFTMAHLRSAMITHSLDAGAPLTAVQHLVGHKHTSTTALYVRPGEAAARAWVNRRRR